MTDTLKILNIVIPAILGYLYLILNKDKKTILKYLGLYFLYIGLGELIGYTLSIVNPAQGNSTFYDRFFIPSTYLLEYLIFFIVLKIRHQRWIIIILSVLYVLSFLIEKFLIHYERGEYSFFSYCVGSIFIMVMSLMYLINLVRSTAILSFRTDPLFWFSTGNLFFQLFTFPFFALMDVWIEYDIFKAYYYFMLGCIYISYAFYTFGILWKKEK